MEFHMSIVPNVGPLVDISGAVLVGTISGDVLYSAPYSASDGAPVGPVMLQAFELVWQALPEVLAQHGQGRFDLMVKQSTERGEEAATLWQSGLSAGALCGVVARKLLKLRMTVYAPQPRPQHDGVTVTEVHDDGSIEWVPPVERVLATLDQVRTDPWQGLRA